MFHFPPPTGDRAASAGDKDAGEYGGTIEEVNLMQGRVPEAAVTLDIGPLTIAYVKIGSLVKSYPSHFHCVIQGILRACKNC